MQIELTDEQWQRLKAIAERENVSMAEVISRAVDDWICKYNTDQQKRKERALSVIGRFNSGLGDLAKNHDKYVASHFPQLKQVVGGI